ncbi:universal stress protein [Dyella jiangningensis]|uniref:Universal stress protein UspA n=1 Tax=Dyella jiangningensis TaxID=1379159 RepID=A0A328PDF1_9GAMM|nr:universal stress protein [Dyella jiangningensis]RAO78115.1 universal stress protein UspA [Dyella jiangningensis]
MNTPSAMASGAPADVLALVTATSPWSPAALAAASLAAAFGARLSGCYIDPGLRMLHGGEPEPSVLALLIDPPREHPGDQASFLAMARESGVHRASWMVTRAGIAQTMRQLGAWHDLIVIERDMVDDTIAFDVLGEALLTCRTPCLLLPPSWQGPVRAERVALTWNGSIESARAMHAALPFVHGAGDVVLLDGEAPTYDDDPQHAPRFDPAVYLANHGIKTRVRRVHATPGEAGVALLREVEGARSDLLVMGAYGHSRVRERVLGGATRHVLQHVNVPVLMQH